MSVSTKSFAARISVVIPVLNERISLQRTLAYLLDVCQPFEVIVSDGGSTDGTVEMVHKQFPTVILLRPRPNEKVTRAIACNKGLFVARAEYVLFNHADSLPPADAVLEITRTLADDTCALGGFRLAFEVFSQ